VLEALFQRCQLASLLPARLHHLLEHRVEVEIAQRAIQVVRAANRATRFHPGETLHGLTGERPHHRLVAVHQCLHQQLRQLFGGQPVEPALGAFAVALAQLLLHLAPHLVEVALAFGDLKLWPTQAEVDLEHCLERTPVRVVLHQRGTERVLERLAILDRDVLHCLHRVEVLSEADRQPRVTQFYDEAGE